MAYPMLPSDPPRTRGPALRHVPTYRRLAAVFLTSVGLAALASQPARAADGILTVKSPVATAEVYVDGQNLGPVPVTKFLAPGPHAVRVVADNYDPYVRKVDIGDGKKVELNAVLMEGTGTAEFVGGGTGARLSVDGKDRGLLPMRLSDLTPGTHDWVVSAPKLEPAEGTLEFVKGKNYLIDVKLRSATGVFVVESTPAGASVTLDGKPVGTTPLRLEGVKPGVHGVVVQGEGRAAVVRSVDTTDGSRGEVNATLPKAGAVLKVTTGSPNATVSLNGASIGQGASVKFGPVEKGKSQLVIEVDGTQVADTVSIPGSGTLLLRRAGTEIERQKPLAQRWGFWAAVGGGAAVAAGAGVATAVAVQPEPLPSGDTVVTLP